MFGRVLHIQSKHRTGASLCYYLYIPIYKNMKNIYIKYLQNSTFT